MCDVSVDNRILWCALTFIARGDMLANSNTSTKATARIGRDDIRPSQATDTYHLSESALRAVESWLFQPLRELIRSCSIRSQGNVPSSPGSRPKWPPEAVDE